MKLKTIIICLMFTFFFNELMCAQESASRFIFELNVEEDQLQMKSIKGTFWNELTTPYNLFKKTYYISESGASGKKTDLDETDFLIQIQLKNEVLQLKGLKGTNWEIYSFSCPNDRCLFTVTDTAVEKGKKEHIESLNSISDKIRELENSKEEIRIQEKEKLKAEIEKINQNEEFKSLSNESIDSLKMELAEKTAKNIENQLSIIENTIDYLKRNPEELSINEDKNTEESKLNINLGGWNLISVSEVVGEKSVSKKDILKGNKRAVLTSENQYLAKSYSRIGDAEDYLVLAVAFNNALPDGGSLNDTGIRFGGSRTFEIGYARDFRVFEKSNWLRLKYGVSLQFNGLKPEGNRIFVKDGNQTNIEEFDFNLRKNKFRMDNLIFPVHLQMGRSKTYVNEETGRVSFSDHDFKFGIGGFVGVNFLNTQNLRYTNDLGIRVRERQRDDFNTNNFLYGLSAYVGWESFSLFAQYNLNPIFRNNPVDTYNFQVGIRFDLY